jgi:hypothetical protein
MQSTYIFSASRAYLGTNVNPYRQYSYLPDTESGRYLLLLLIVRSALAIMLRTLLSNHYKAKKLLCWLHVLAFGY